MGSIYKITSPNGKIYIGQTRNNPQKRWKSHLSHARRLKRDIDNGTDICYKYKHVCLYKTMVKYGINNFAFEVLETNILLDDLDDREIANIAHYNSLAPRGMNLQTGGGGFNHHEQTKKLMSDKAKMLAPLLLDKYRREETKGLPMNIVYHGKGNSVGYAICGHPNCSYKSFTVSKYGDLETCKNAAIEFLNTLVNTKTVYHHQKKDPHLPIGITRFGSGFLAKRKINGVIYKKSFGGKNIPEDEKLQKAIKYLNTLVKEEGSETKCLSA